MGLLYLIRHGQASADGEDYDRLSPLGVEQGRVLGEFWAGRGLTFDRVFVGPRRRHRGTHDAVAEVYRRRGLPWPEPELLPELDEHHGQKIFESYLARLLPSEPSRERFLAMYMEQNRQWVRGEIETPPELEPWAAFRTRVAAGLAKLTSGGPPFQKSGPEDRGPRGRNVATFTSGGAVATAVGQALGLDDEKIIELSWRVRNAAVSELLFSSSGGAAPSDSRRPASRLTLHTFNTIPHLTEPRLLTYI